MRWLGIGMTLPNFHTPCPPGFKKNMEIKELKRRPGIRQNTKLYNSYAQFDKLLGALRIRDLSDETVVAINDEIDQLDSFSGPDNQWIKKIKKIQFRIIQRVEKKHQLVAKNHYRNKWMAVGMAAFGLPLGAAFAMSLGNLAFIGIGLPIGMVMGMAVGTGMDKKAGEEGRQLNFEIE